MRNNRKKRSAFLKIGRRKRAALCCIAMMTMPLLVGFTVNETKVAGVSATAAENSTEDETVTETENPSQVNTAATKRSVSELMTSEEADEAFARSLHIKRRPVTTKPAEETPAETQTPAAGEEKSGEEKPAETQTPATGEEKPESETPDENVETPEEEEVDDGLSQVDREILAHMKQYAGLTIVDIEFEGASASTLPTAEAAIIEHVGDEFIPEVALRDRTAIVETGYFYDAYQTFERVPEGVVVKYHMLENPVLKEIVFEGNTIFETPDLEKIMTVERGEILNSNTLHDNIAAVQEKYRGDGYILMKITDMNIDKDGVLNLKINEGMLEGYAVKGNKKTKDKVILREMRQPVGQPFNAKLARRSMQRVYNLGFFEDVNLKMNPGVEPNAIVLEINVKEKRTGTFGLGAGYSSADGLIGMVSLGDTNFRGRGDAVNVVYEMSGDDTDAHGFSFSYRHPWLDKKETAIALRVYNRTYEYDDYDTKGNLKEEYMRKYSGGEITLSRPMSEYSTNYITFRNRKDKYVKHVSNGNAGDRSGLAGLDWRKKNFGTTRSITLEHVTDTRDNIYNPTTGGRVSLTGEFGGVLGGDFDFQKYSIEHQFYRLAGNHDQVWSLRGQYGVGHGDLTEFNQFRMGGQSSLRGYREDQFRGNRMILGTLEYRFPLAKKVQGAIFTDWGGTWDSGFAPKKINGSAGVGIALNTPLGPLRLDYGRGRQGGRIHFSVGGAF